MSLWERAYVKLESLLAIARALEPPFSSFKLRIRQFRIEKASFTLTRYLDIYTFYTNLHVYGKVSIQDLIP